jgi:putative Ca2+/H+ antiporter (TMEM165/GDT1 family)
MRETHCRQRAPLLLLLLVVLFFHLPCTAGEDVVNANGEVPDGIVEHGKGIVPPDGGAAAAARDIFDLLDQNHDGRMDREEFHHAVDEFEDFLRHHPHVQTVSWFHPRSWFAASPATTVKTGPDGKPLKKDLSFWNGFTGAVGLIVATEIGDKTFFIAAVLSMKQDRRAVFGGAILALVLMTVLSTLMGLLLPQFMDRKYTHILAGVLFGYFGIRLLWESQHMASNKVSEELEEVEEELLHQKNKKGEDESFLNDESGASPRMIPILKKPPKWIWNLPCSSARIVSMEQARRLPFVPILRRRRGDSTSIRNIFVVQNANPFSRFSCRVLL